MGDIYLPGDKVLAEVLLAQGRSEALYGTVVSADEHTVTVEFVNEIHPDLVALLSDDVKHLVEPKTFVREVSKARVWKENPDA